MNITEIKLPQTESEAVEWLATLTPEQQVRLLEQSKAQYVEAMQEWISAVSGKAPKDEAKSLKDTEKYWKWITEILK